MESLNHSFFISSPVSFLCAHSVGNLSRLIRTVTRAPVLPAQVADFASLPPQTGPG